MLRFVGVPIENASQTAALQSRYRLAPPAASSPTSHNPLEPQLLADLEAYFRPFQAQLRKLLDKHRKCFNERVKLKAAMKKQRDMATTALARAG